MPGLHMRWHLGLILEYQKPNKWKNYHCNCIWDEQKWLLLWLILYVNLTGPQNAQTSVKHCFGVSVRVFLSEINIRVNKLSKTDCSS